MALPEYVAVTAYIPAGSVITQFPESPLSVIVHVLVPSDTVTDPVRSKRVSPPTVTLYVTFPAVPGLGEADTTTDGTALLTVSDIVSVAET